MSNEVTPGKVEHGGPGVAVPNEIQRSVVGSGVYGIPIAGTDDHDEMGVYIEPPEYVLVPDAERERVLAVKRGEVPRDEVSAEIGRLEAAVRDLGSGRCPLPVGADVEAISAWAVSAQRRHWGW